MMNRITSMLALSICIVAAVFALVWLFRDWCLKPWQRQFVTRSFIFDGPCSKLARNGIKDAGAVVP